MYVLDTPGVFFAKHARYDLKLALTGKILEHLFLCGVPSTHLKSVDLSVKSA